MAEACSGLWRGDGGVWFCPFCLQSLFVNHLELGLIELSEAFLYGQSWISLTTLN